KANQVGLELAKKLAPNHEVAVYTHDDTNHVHNHIVINSVNFETGKKYQAHGKEAIERARSLSDEVCKSHDLRSEERRVGKECRSRGAGAQERQKREDSGACRRGTAQ